jgi:hypothetical protein
MLYVDAGNNAVGVGTQYPAITRDQQAGTFLTVYGTGTNGGILELGSTKSTDNNTVGILSFVNDDNANNSAGQRRYIAQVRARIETDDSNAGDDSGGNLVFQTKPLNGPLDDRLEITADGRGLSQFTAKAWCRWDNATISDSHNVSSCTDISSGVFGVNLANALGNALYSVCLTKEESDNTAVFAGWVDRDATTTSFFKTHWSYAYSGSQGKADTYHNHAIVFGDN